MELLVEPPIDVIRSRAIPIDTSFGPFEGGRGAELNIAGQGSVRVDERTITASVVDDQFEDQLVAFANGWGRTLWLALNGVFSFHGVTAQKDGVGIAILAESRLGASMTAVSLAEIGWSVISDGACALTLEKKSTIALPGPQPLEVDAAIAEMTTLKWPAMPAPTMRPRIAVTVPRFTNPCKLVHIVDLRVSRLYSTPEILAADRSEGGAVNTLRERCAVGNAVIERNRQLREGLDSFCSGAITRTRFSFALTPQGDRDSPFRPSDVARLIDLHFSESESSSESTEADGT
ncbi:MAG: hypothetical protein WCK06_06630 [Actinomycetota bacterium]